MSYTDDPVADYARHCKAQEEEEKRLPRCHKCKRRISDDYLYHIYGEILCEECLNKEYRKDTEDFIE